MYTHLLISFANTHTQTHTHTGSMNVNAYEVGKLGIRGQRCNVFQITIVYKQT